MKLFLTLEDDDGYKVERITQYSAGITFPSLYIDMNDVVNDMDNSLEKSKQPL